MCIGLVSEKQKFFLIKQLSKKIGRLQDVRPISDELKSMIGQYLHVLNDNIPVYGNNNDRMDELQREKNAVHRHDACDSTLEAEIEIIRINDDDSNINLFLDEDVYYSDEEKYYSDEEIYYSDEDIYNSVEEDQSIFENLRSNDKDREDKFESSPSKKTVEKRKSDVCDSLTEQYNMNIYLVLDKFILDNC